MEIMPKGLHEIIESCYHGGRGGVSAVCSMYNWLFKIHAEVNLIKMRPNSTYRCPT